jgi:hypothetical protein
MDTVGAKRVALDTIEILFASLPDAAMCAQKYAAVPVAQGTGRHYRLNLSWSRGVRFRLCSRAGTSEQW